MNQKKERNIVVGQAMEAAHLALRSKRELFGKGLEVELGGEEEAVEQ